MNAFFRDELVVSKIHTCVFVPSGTGKAVHRNRPSHGLVIKLSGETVYSFDDGHKYLVHAEELFYLPKFSNYDVVRNLHGDCIAINFDLLDSSVTYPFFSLPASSGHKYVLEFLQFLQEWNTRKSGYMNRCMAHLYNIICMCQQDKAQQYVPVRNRRLIADGMDYIAMHLIEPALTVSQIAQHLGITPEYFRKLFRESYGISPKHYILNLRMEKACELILSGELRISAIAQMCGYDDENYFSREFKRLHDCPPSFYAKKQMEQL